jgi:hypothetical protein
MKWYKDKNPQQFKRFAAEIFDQQNADLGIEKLEAWFKKIGSPVSLADANVPREAIAALAENAAGSARLWGMDDMYTMEVIAEILEKA